MEPDKEEILEVGARLKGTLKDKFLAIKARRGVTADSELVRILVSEYYEREFKCAEVTA